MSEGAWSEGSRSEGNMTDDNSGDEDFFMDLENIIDDVDVNKKEFHIHVDEDAEWVQKTTKEASSSGVDFTEGRSHTNILLNNLCEVLNGKIQGGGDKPIIYCLEYIKEYLMKRICNVQRDIDRCHGPLTPTATTLLDQMKRKAQKH
uniref:Uncharacterized protein n=1 Tax=Lactuca sativa TaxID=4236 RepID=A0A9R1WQZ4_LACSA|nr:hypothetical protein LSAT_V11C100041450 [Lactuca sativa]